MLRSRWALWAGILVFPPLGLVLWWMRRGVGPVARIAGTLGICAVAIVELFLVYGMRLEWNGALKVSGVSFETRAQRDARLEGSRARQRAEAPAPAVGRSCGDRTSGCPTRSCPNHRARPAGVLDGLPRSEPRGRVRRDGDRNSLAGGGLAPAMETACGRRIRILHGGRGPRVHHRAAARPRSHHGV